MRTRTLNAAASTTCLAALLACAAPACADQILQVHDASLTTYVPSSKSNIQDVRPLPEQRGVGLDGAPRGLGGPPGEGGDPYPKCGKAAPVGPADLSPGWDGGLVTPGNPLGPSGGGPEFGDAGGGAGLSAPPGMDLPTGTPSISDIDLAFPAQVPWIIGRSYNCRQKDSGGSYFASSGYQGMNWFQTSQPELVFHDTTPDTSDMIYLVYGADRYIEFKRALDGQQQPSADSFKAVNGAAGAIRLTTGTGPDLATWYRPDGWRMVFFWVGDGDIDDDIEGSIWKVIDPAGNTAYVGHATDAGCVPPPCPIPEDCQEFEQWNPDTCFDFCECMIHSGCPSFDAGGCLADCMSIQPPPDPCSGLPCLVMCGCEYAHDPLNFDLTACILGCPAFNPSYRPPDPDRSPVQP